MMERVNNVTIPVQCRECRAVKNVTMPLDGLRRWKAGALIQKALPGLTPDERELLISRTCGTCFDRLYAEEE